MKDWIDKLLNSLTPEEVRALAARAQQRVKRPRGAPPTELGRLTTPYHSACRKVALQVLREERRWQALPEQEKKATLEAGRKTIPKRLPEYLKRRAIEAGIEASAILKRAHLERKDRASPYDAIDNHVKRRIRRWGPIEETN